ncbi:hypothetical protein E4T44_00053 [Aureobasidium sp. EXF-8845]|nr:hypothetical protein E4T44_00053 [Aureobasidium sp. EXF-8845]KAI4857784.1 hypothetical protein E4T45_00715 [Aureobasidium sp. EXF-8846]
MSLPYLINLPEVAPEAAKLGEVRGSDNLPFALYDLVGTSSMDIEELVATIDETNIIGMEPNAFQLVRLAPGFKPEQKTLHDALNAHVQYCITHIDKLEYFPFGFLAVHDGDWQACGLYIVSIDFEAPFKVTGFRISLDDITAAANTLRDDDDGAREVREMYEMKE